MARRIRPLLGVCSTLRPFLLAASHFVAILALCSSAVAAEGVTWVTDFDVAVRQAREQKKLLIVVDFAEDFTRITDATRSQNAYAAMTLADKRCPAAPGFVVRAHPAECGLSGQHLGYHAGKGESKVQGPEHAVTYFLTPDGRVWHYLSGFVSSETFVKEARWMLDCYADAQRFPEEEQPQAVRENHQEMYPRRQRARTPFPPPGEAAKQISPDLFTAARKSP